jgi:nucleoside-diphosphate-sugar epimerase
MKILVTGGCGYKGHILVPKLLSLGHTVEVIDTQWFGNFLAKHENLKVFKKDIRDIDNISLEGIDCIIHLASIANDPSGDLNPKLTWEVNALATMQLIDKASRAEVGRFIYASSSSVYGIKEEEHVTEDLELKPITEYNKTKMVAERVLLSYKNKMVVQIIRPATVCGYSPRMRLDVSVNILTRHAFKNKIITVFGGNQVRPNVHIEDLIDVYIHFLDNPQFDGIYNVGFENISILDIAKKVTKYLPAKIDITQSNDPRSYRVNSDKLLSTGYKPKKSVENAIQEMIIKFKSGEILDSPQSSTVEWMKSQNLHK